MKLWGVVVVALAFTACKDKAPATKSPEDQKPRMPTFSTTCTNNGDCILVNIDPCDPCGCIRAPMAKSEEERAKAYVASVTCPPRPLADCADCVDMVPECVSGRCTATKK